MATEIKKVTETYNIRGDQIEVTAPMRVNTKTQEPVFDEALDNEAVNQALNVYRQNHQFITTERIKRLRQRYGLSQRDFAALLGWSPTTIATYETGALPSRANNTALLALEANPLIVQDSYETNSKMTQAGKRTLSQHLEQLDTKTPQKFFEEGISRLFDKTDYTVYAGYQSFDFKKFTGMVTYFADRIPYLTKTMLNKLLFYADFTYFGENTVSMSGVAYEHLQYGPVPHNYQLLYATMMTTGELRTQERTADELVWEYLVAQKPAPLSLFNEEERQVLRNTVERFKKMTAKEISQHSHQEEAWKATRNRQTIAYTYAENLSTLNDPII